MRRSSRADCSKKVAACVASRDAAVSRLSSVMAVRANVPRAGELLGASLPSANELVDRYRVVGQLGGGGMAAVFLVRREGVGGFDKLLAMKMVLPHLIQDERSFHMFLDEARIGA